MSSLLGTNDGMRVGVENDGWMKDVIFFVAIFAEWWLLCESGNLCWRTFVPPHSVNRMIGFCDPCECYDLFESFHQW